MILFKPLFLNLSICINYGLEEGVRNETGFCYCIIHVDPKLIAMTEGEESMFVNIIRFPPIKEGKDKEFREWFEWSNQVYSKFDGFVSRSLLRSTKGGEYVGLVEHESEETFMAMHLSPERQKAWDKVEPLLNGSPKPTFHDVILTTSKKRS